MVKAKSDVQRILDKIEGEIKTAKKSSIQITDINFVDGITRKKSIELLIEELIKRTYESGYFDGKAKFIYRPAETASGWIENLWDRKGVG